MQFIEENKEKYECGRKREKNHELIVNFEIGNGDRKMSFLCFLYD